MPRVSHPLLFLAISSLMGCVVRASDGAEEPRSQPVLSEVDPTPHALPPWLSAETDVGIAVKLSGNDVVETTVYNRMATSQKYLLPRTQGDQVLSVEVTDPQGPIEARLTGQSLQLNREPTLPFSVRTQIRLARPTSGAIVLMRPLGQMVPLSPDTDGKPNNGRVVKAQVEITHGNGVIASSLGFGPSSPRALSTEALTRVTLAVGIHARARFQAAEGEDEVALFGQTDFDPRWAAAELALLRTAVDGFFLGADPQRFTWLVIGQEDKAATEPVVVEPVVGGFLIRVASSLPFETDIRMAVAQSLARRWLGWGYQIVGDDGFLELGLSRFVARKALNGIGLLEPSDLASELNMLVRLDRTVDPDKNAALVKMARGALFASYVDVLLADKKHKKHSPTLRSLLRKLLSKTDERGSGPKPLDVMGSLKAQTEIELPTLEEAKEGLPSKMLRKLGSLPCVRAREGAHSTFDLGFTYTEGNPGEVKTVNKKGPALRTGMAPGDQILNLRFRRLDPLTPVQMTIKRGEREREVRFRPAGKKVRGPIFRASRGAACRD